MKSSKKNLKQAFESIDRVVEFVHQANTRSLNRAREFSDGFMLDAYYLTYELQESLPEMTITGKTLNSTLFAFLIKECKSSLMLFYVDSIDNQVVISFFYPRVN